MAIRRGEDQANPIIVMVHSGAPMKPVLHTYQIAWEKDYTIEYVGNQFKIPTIFV